MAATTVVATTVAVAAVGTDNARLARLSNPPNAVVRLSCRWGTLGVERASSRHERAALTGGVAKQHARVGALLLQLYRFGRPALWTVLVVVLVLVLDLAGFDYDYENDDEEDALPVCRRFTSSWERIRWRSSAQASPHCRCWSRLWARLSSLAEQAARADFSRFNHDLFHDWPGNRLPWANPDQRSQE